MDEKQAWKCACEATAKLIELDKENKVEKTKEQYEAFCNGFRMGVLFIDSLPLEQHAFGALPEAHIRIIVGLACKTRIDKDTTAPAMMVSSECKGQTDREGLVVLLGAALAAITAYSQNLSPAFNDKLRFATELSSASAGYLGTLRNQMQPDIRLVEHDQKGG